MIRLGPAVVAATLLGCWCGSLAWAAEPDRASPRRLGPFEVESLAEGVYLLRPEADRDDLTNSLVIEREDGLLVVESQPSPDAASELLAAVAQLSSRPLRYLVLSNAHAETAGGAAAFPVSTLVIATLGARDALGDPGFGFGSEMRARVGRSWTAPPIRPPVLVLHARTEFDDPLNEVELLPLGQAHSSTDLMVLLPNQNILYAGAILFPDRNPYAADADVGGWLSVLNHIAKLRPARAIPLRGEPLDVRQVRMQRDSLAWLRGRVELGFIDRVPADRLTDWVLDSDELGEHFDLQAEPSFLRGLIDRVVADAVTERKKRGRM